MIIVKENVISYVSDFYYYNSSVKMHASIQETALLLFRMHKKIIVRLAKFCS